LLQKFPRIRNANEMRAIVDRRRTKRAEAKVEPKADDEAKVEAKVEVKVEAEGMEKLEPSLHFL